MPTKASSPTKNKGKVFFVAKSSGPLLGRLPLNFLALLLVLEMCVRRSDFFQDAFNAFAIRAISVFACNLTWNSPVR